MIAKEANNYKYIKESNRRDAKKASECKDVLVIFTSYYNGRQVEETQLLTGR